MSVYHKHHIPFDAMKDDVMFLKPSMFYLKNCAVSTSVYKLVERNKRSCTTTENVFQLLMAKSVSVHCICVRYLLPDVFPKSHCTLSFSTVILTYHLVYNQTYHMVSLFYKSSVFFIMSQVMSYQVTWSLSLIRWCHKSCGMHLVNHISQLRIYPFT